MRGLLDGWGIAERYPELEFSESRLIAYAFATPWLEPSWLGTIILGALAALILAGAFMPYPLLRRTSADPGRAGRRRSGSRSTASCRRRAAPSACTGRPPSWSG